MDPTELAAYERRLKCEAQDHRQKEHNDKLTFRVTLASTIIAVIAALAALWAGYEAHQTRVEDERPFIAVDATPDIPQALKFHSNENMIAGQMIPLQTLVTAFGKSPSEQIHVTCATVADNPGTQWKPAKDYAEWHFVYLIPSRSGEIGCPYVGPASTRPPHADITFIQFGVAEYENESGSKFRTPFCHMILAGFPVFHVEPCEENYGLPKLE